MRLSLILVPYDSGHRDERMGRGPGHLLRHGAGSRLRAMGHDVSAEWVLTDASFLTEVATTFELHAALAGRVRAAVETERFPIVLSGNCGSAVGTLAGLASAADGADDVAVVWLDAHGELNTPDTTTSGFLDGMGLSIIIGQAWRALAARVPGFQPLDPRRVLLVGARDLDPAERTRAAESGVSILTVERLRAADPAAAVADSLGRLAPGVRRVYVHLDPDVLDPRHGRANPYATPDGLAPDELVAVIRAVRAWRPLAALGVASYDPSCDDTGRVWEAIVGVMEEVGSAGTARGA